MSIPGALVGGRILNNIHSPEAYVAKLIKAGPPEITSRILSDKGIIGAGVVGRTSLNSPERLIPVFVTHADDCRRVPNDVRD